MTDFETFFAVNTDLDISIRYFLISDPEDKEFIVYKEAKGDESEEILDTLTGEKNEDIPVVFLKRFENKSQAMSFISSLLKGVKTLKAV